MESQLSGPIVLKKIIQTLPSYIDFHEKSNSQEFQQQSESEEESKENKDKTQENINIMKNESDEKDSRKIIYVHLLGGF